MRVLIFPFLAVTCFGANFTAATQPRALAFEVREGQFVSHGSDFTLSVTSGAATLKLGDHAVRMSASGARRPSTLEASDRMPGKANYLLGRDVRASSDLYGRVRWREAYPGIDVVFRGNQEHLEYDLEIGARRDPGRIRLAFDGVDGIRVDGHGDLVLSAGTLRIRQPKPFAYQLVDGKQRPVEAAYWVDAAKLVRFRLGAYDHARALVIDPVLVFDNTFGGSGTNAAVGLASDADGNLYVTGTTNATDFGTVNAAQNRLGIGPLLSTADGGKTWNFPTLTGATVVNVVAAAPSNPAVVYAATSNGIFQSGDGGATWTATASVGLSGSVTALAFDAGSATTLYAGTAQGVYYSTDGGATWRNPIFGLSGTGVITIAAHPTQSGTVFASLATPPGLFRSTDGGQSWRRLTVSPFNQLVPVSSVALTANGAMIVATYQSLLTSSDSGDTFTTLTNQGAANSQGLALSPAASNTMYLVSPIGLQTSTDGGHTFTVTLSSVRFSSQARVAVDPGNPATVYAADFNLLYRSTDAGQTWLQITLPFSISPQYLYVSPSDSRVFLGAFTQRTVFVTKWSADGTQILYSTYLGGSGGDGPRGIAVDGSGSAYITGYTSSVDFPTTTGAFRTQLGSPQDVFVAKLSPDGSQLVYSTLMGSDKSGSSSIAVDSTGNAVITGFTDGSFPIIAAYQAIPAPGCYLYANPSTPTFGDSFVTRLSADGSTLVYSTLLGGSCSSAGNAVAVDANGNAWVAGSTQSPDFPLTKDAMQSQFAGGMYDGFLARFNPSGGLDYATYIGGPGYDSINAVGFDAAGSVYLTGETGGLSQPASDSAFQSQASASCPAFFIGPSEFYPQGNAFVLKLDAKAQAVQGLTYLGAPFCLSGTSIAIDAAGEPWISGTLDVNGSAPQTASPLRIGMVQGFVSKLSSDFTQLLFSTYFDAVSGLALDSSGLAYVAGTNPYAATGAQSVYLAKIDPTPASISLDSIASVVPSVNPSNRRGIAPGELIQILGQNVGPADPTTAVPDSGVLPSTLAGVQVTFDGVAVPLLSVSASEIDLVAPLGLGAKPTTSVQIQYNGAQSNPVQVSVDATDLQILGVYNADGSPNSAANPGQAGSPVMLFLAGAGQTVPPSPDGQINTTSLPLGVQVQLQWFNNDPFPTILPLLSSGAAIGKPAGVFQVTFTAPAATLMNVNLLMGSASARFNVYVQ